MRLWHQSLIPRLPRQQLLGQHRECCALRGGGWGKKHTTVQYVFKYDPYKLFQYHCLVMDEMTARGYQVAPAWRVATYRGKTLPPYHDLSPIDPTDPLYPEHDADYLQACLINLRHKGIDLSTP